MHTKTRSRMKTLWQQLLPVLLLLGGGYLLSIPGAATRKQQIRQDLQPPPLKAENTDILSQQLAFFTLGGMRSLVAEVLTLDATDAWLKRDWERVHRRWSSATTMCPHRSNYWASASYEMASNAAADAYQNSKLTPEQRVTHFRSYIREGELFLLQGIENNPDDWKLHIKLAELYSNLYRRPRFSKAADAYATAIRLGAPEYYKRFRFYALCRAAGREHEAWQLGRELFNDPEHRLPSLVTMLFVLQHKIKVPPHEALSVYRLFRNTPQESREQILQTAIDELQKTLRNDLRFPTNGIEDFLQQHDAL